MKRAAGILWISIVAVSQTQTGHEERIHDPESSQASALCRENGNEEAGERWDEGNTNGGGCLSSSQDEPRASAGWTEVPNSRFLDHVNCTGVSNCNPPGVLDAWSSGVLDTKRNALVIFGGGHHDSYYNGVDAFDLDTRTWSNLLPSGPGPVDERVCANVDVRGNPVSRHSYGMLAYIPAVRGRIADYLLMHGGSGASLSGCLRRDTWLFNLATNAWEFVGDGMANSPMENWAVYCAYDAGTDKVYCAAEASGWFGFLRFDPAARTWSTILPYHSSGSGKLHHGSNPVVMRAPGHPLDGLFVMLSGDQPGKLLAIDLAAPSFQFLKMTGALAISQTTEGVGLDWDGSKLVAWSGVVTTAAPTSVWEIDSALNVTEKTFSTGPGLHLARGIYGKWRYSAASNAFVALHDAGSNVYLYRGAPPPQPTPAGGMSFSERCAQPDVVLCDPLDTEGPWGVKGKLMKNPDGTTGIPTKIWWQVWRGVQQDRSRPEAKPPALDTGVKASGTGSLRFTLLSNSDETVGGNFATNFADDLSQQFGEGDTFYVQYRWRADCNFMYRDCNPASPNFGKVRRAFRAINEGTTAAKLAIISTGDSVPGVSANSCTFLEIVAVHRQDHMLSAYHSCGWYEGMHEPTGESWLGSTQFDFQPTGKLGAGDKVSPTCWYIPDPKVAKIVDWGYTGPDCFLLEADEWITVQTMIRIGRWQTDRKGVPESHVTMWAAREGEPQRVIIDHNLYLHAPEKPNEKFGKIWLTPFATAKDPGEAHPVANIWYDELIVSRSFIPDPK